MFDEDYLIKIAEQAVQKAEEASHFEETGNLLHHFDFEILKVEPAVFTSGRTGDFYKFNFEYQITLLDEAGLVTEEDDVRSFRRSLRMNPEGKITGIGGRIEI